MSDSRKQEPEIPGKGVDIPLPPGLLECMGYRGKARFVGMAWSPAGDELIVDDGRSAGTGESWSFIAFKRHRAVAPMLEGFNLGASDRIAEHCLLIDQQRNLAFIVPIRDAETFLRNQWPPEPPLTEEQRQAIQEKMEELLKQGGQQIDSAAVGRWMADQRGRLGRLMAWLDMAPVPKGGKGA